MGRLSAVRRDLGATPNTSRPQLREHPSAPVVLPADRRLVTWGPAIAEVLGELPGVAGRGRGGELDGELVTDLHGDLLARLRVDGPSVATTLVVAARREDGDQEERQDQDAQEPPRTWRIARHRDALARRSFPIRLSEAVPRPSRFERFVNRGLSR